MNTGAIEAFEAAMHTRTNTLEWLEEDLRRARQWNDWTGQGADAATTGISRLGDAVTDTAASAQAAKHTADRLYNGVAALWEHVKNADALATSHAFVIGDDGGLIDLRAGVATVVGADEAAARADARRDLEQAVHDILLNGRELEATAVGELTSVASGSIDDGEATTVVAAGASQSRVPIPPPSADPAAVAAWWSTLADPELAARGELSDLQKELIKGPPGGRRTAGRRPRGGARPGQQSAANTSTPPGTPSPASSPDSSAPSPATGGWRSCPPRAA